LKKPVSSAPWQRPSAKTVFYFFKKLSLPTAPCNYARQSWEHPSWENFPRVAERICQERSAKDPLSTAPLGKEATFCYIYIYIYTSPSKQVHKSAKCLKFNETSSQHDQLSPRAYGECSCGGKGGTGDWRTCSPLGAW
jgi:hypothetical protein